MKSVVRRLALPALLLLTAALGGCYYPPYGPYGYPPDYHRGYGYGGYGAPPDYQGGYGGAYAPPAYAGPGPDYERPPPAPVPY